MCVSKYLNNIPYERVYDKQCELKEGEHLCKDDEEPCSVCAIHNREIHEDSLLQISSEDSDSGSQPRRNSSYPTLGPPYNPNPTQPKQGHL